MKNKKSIQKRKTITSDEQTDHIGPGFETGTKPSDEIPF